MPTLFLSKCILSGNALTTVALSCCDGKTTENKKHKVCLLVERERGGWKKPKRAGSRSQTDDSTWAPPPLGSPAPVCSLPGTNFSMVPLVPVQQTAPVWQQTDRLYKSLIVRPPLPSSLSSLLPAPPPIPSSFIWETDCCSCEMKFAYTSETNKKKCLWADFFVLLLFCKCTIKYICWCEPSFVFSAAEYFQFTPCFCVRSYCDCSHPLSAANWPRVRVRVPNYLTGVKLNDWKKNAFRHISRGGDRHTCNISGSMWTEQNWSS